MQPADFTPLVMNADEKASAVEPAGGEESGADQRRKTELLQLGEKLSAGAERPDVSAGTIVRLMGLITQGDLALLESKLDMLSTKLTALTVRTEKLVTMLGNAPTGSDLERIDVQIGALRTLIREVLGKAAASPPAASGSGKTAQKQAGSDTELPSSQGVDE